MKNIIDALYINIQIFFCIIHPTNKLVGFLMSFIVINISDLLDKRYENVYEDIFQVVNNANKKCVKVIIETCYLSNTDKIKACDLIIEAGADFVKTSTGFGNGGATIDDIRLLKKASKNHIKIKASGGIKTKDFAIKLIDAGANRLGCSSSVKIVN